MRPSGNPRLDSEAGFGIIEVLVSAILVVIVATGVFAAFDTATKASGANKARSTAASLARGDQELLRSKTAEQLAALAPTRTEEVDGRTYTIASSTEWVADRNGTPTCTTADGRADYLEIRSSVTWTEKGVTQAAVVQESLRAIPRGAFRPNEGTIAVKVIDRNGAGVEGAGVTITGTAGYSGQTNALGCLLIDRVPIGDYEAEITKTIPSVYVTDANPNPAVVEKEFSVAKEQVSSVPVTLDRAGTARVAFVRNNTTTTASDGADGFTVSQVGLGTPTFRTFLHTGRATTLYSATESTASTSSSTRSLFPFSTPYSVWAGTCQEANPANYPGAPIHSQTIPLGAVATAVNVNMPRLTFSFKQAPSGNTTYRYVIKPVASACARTVVATVSSTSTATIGRDLPYGDYQVCMQVGTSTSTTATNIKTATRTFQNRSATGRTEPLVTIPDSPTGRPCAA